MLPNSLDFREAKLTWKIPHKSILSPRIIFLGKCFPLPPLAGFHVLGSSCDNPRRVETQNKTTYESQLDN